MKLWDKKRILRDAVDTLVPPRYAICQRKAYLEKASTLKVIATIHSWDTQHHQFRVLYGRNGEITFSCWDLVVGFLTSPDFKKSEEYYWNTPSVYYEQVVTGESFAFRHETRYSYTLESESGRLKLVEHDVIVAPALGEQYSNHYNHPHLNAYLGISFECRGEKAFCHHHRRLLREGLNEIIGSDKWRSYNLRKDFATDNWYFLSRSTQKSLGADHEYLVALDSSPELVYLTGQALQDMPISTWYGDANTWVWLPPQKSILDL